MPSEVRTALEAWINAERLMQGLRAALLVAVGLLVARLVSRGISRLTARYLETQHSVLARRVSFYGVLFLFAAAALRQLGFDLGVLLGAAGILSVAIGFAAQTSASNLISGLFLIAERPFALGDLVRIGGTTGEVLSIDLLSVKLRTFDNVFVRIPNETLIKSEVQTLSRFPIRRVDLAIGVAYKEDLPRVRKLLLAVAERNPLALEEPAPQFFVLGYGESAIDVQFSVWVQRPNYVTLKTNLLMEIKQCFDDEGVEIPFPHRSLYAGSATTPLPIEIVRRPSDDDDPRG